MRHKIVPALGCTEPIAIAFAAAKAAETLAHPVESVGIAVSGNLLKNGMGVGRARDGSHGA